MTARDAGLVACRTCASVWPQGRARCARCGSRLQSRDDMSLQRVLALLAAGLVCYIPANLNPMLITRTLGKTQDSTIIGGAIELAQHGDIAVAGVILIASVLIPISKFLAIGFLTDGFDEALACPTEDSARIAVATQNILREEAHLCDVIDPLGGSSSVESLTNELE
ncbi:MAG: methylmalonyl-CoA mutase family protein, partial [Pseudomonadota bacterium]